MIDFIEKLSFVDISTLALSIVASIISVKSLWVTKTQAINTVITSNRIEWINSVRTLVQQFMEEYLKEDASNQYTKQKLATNILLYLRHDVSVYKDFLNILNHCTNNSFCVDDYDKLICATQDMLNDVWNRMKREAGISKRSEMRLKKKLKQEKLKNK